MRSRGCEKWRLAAVALAMDAVVSFEVAVVMLVDVRAFVATCVLVLGVLAAVAVVVGDAAAAAADDVGSAMQRVWMHSAAADCQPRQRQNVVVA